MNRTFFYTVTLGFALFAMFFGAGNLVFPLKLGVTAQENWMIAALGFVITGVVVPLLGFFAMSYYNGDYRSFFAQLGNKAGFGAYALILLLLGPGGIVARCIALCYASVQNVYSDVSMLQFSLIACAVVFLFSFRENSVVSLLGKLLTPLKLVTLGMLVYQGLIASGATFGSPTDTALFWHGLIEGLETLDLLAALAFSCFLVPRLKEIATMGHSMHKIALKVGAICGLLLTTIYLGFCFIAARHSASLPQDKSELLLISLSEYLLGPWGAKLTMLLILLACLTTVIALTSIFAKFLQKELFKDRIGYELSLLVTLAIACIVSLLRFDGIALFLLPLMQIAYPALIVLCLVNIYQKMGGTKDVRLPFYATFGASLAYKLMV